MQSKNNLSKMNLPVVTVVGVILEDADGRILLTQRPANKSMPFLWEFPGGKVEPGETPEHATVREIYEEIGIQIEIQDLNPLTFVSLTYPDFHIILLCFYCHKWTGEPVAREGQEGIDWVKPEDLKKYPMREANVRLIPILESRAKKVDTNNKNRFSTKLI